MPEITTIDGQTIRPEFLPSTEDAGPRVILWGTGAMEFEPMQALDLANAIIGMLADQPGAFVAPRPEKGPEHPGVAGLRAFGLLQGGKA